MKILKKVDRSVVRNVAYTRDKVSNMERHNERKNQYYNNCDVELQRAEWNIHFKKCENGYLQTFDDMLKNEIISTRGLKKDAKIIDEMIFDVNSEYFESHGGYEYAKHFFKEVYQMAVKEIGDEQYILSAVMHADERNKLLSEKYGHNIYHYHLHVVYVPVVDMEVKWTKRCKDPALIGTVKEVVKQVSNSKKWRSEKVIGKDGKEHLEYSYSLLQDRYFEHMQQAGFKDFERGERGSTVEHLNVLEYKVQKDKMVSNDLNKAIKKKKSIDGVLNDVIGKKEQAVSVLDAKIEKNKKQILELKKDTAVLKQEAVSFAKIEDLGKKHTIRGDIAITPSDWQRVSELAKEGVRSRSIIEKLKKQISDLLHQISALKKLLQKYEGQSVTDTMRYFQAKQRAPNRMAEVIAEIMQQPSEKSKGYDRQEYIHKRDMQER